ncbi:MAG: RluA family pseudouridine synthase [Thermogutta sp.]
MSQGQSWLAFPGGVPEILYECRECLVVNKPPGILVQSPPGIPSLVEVIRDFLAAREQPRVGIYLGVPHRLDRPVTGAILFTRHSRATRRITEQFESRMIRKIYWAVVQGRVEPNVAVWRDFIRKIPNEPQAEIVPESHPDARQAVLNYRVINHWDNLTWLEIHLETGRMHQIRIQASSRNHAIVGDWQYGSSIDLAPEQPDPKLKPIALHAREMTFLHPMTFETVRVIAPLPRYWRIISPVFSQFERTSPREDDSRGAGTGRDASKIEEQ